MEQDAIGKIVECAWMARRSALAWRSGTKVGCAIYTNKGSLVLGYNIEGLWMTSIHAEVCAISRLPEKRGQKIKVIAIASQTTHFTPCGACLDWIFQFSDAKTIIVISDKAKKNTIYKLDELMPHYPRQ